MGKRTQKSDSPSPLADLRRALDQVDANIVRSIAQRLDIVRQVGKTKQDRPDGIRDAARERDVLDKVEAAARASGISGPLLRRIFADIIAHSVSMQATSLSGTGGDQDTEMVVALHGDTYSYDHLAAQHYLAGRGLRGRFVPCDGLQAAVEKVQAGDVNLAFLPIENTFAGSSNQVYDLLREHELQIVGEESFKIEHCLIAHGDIPLSAIERVHSHPQILEQCSRFLEGLPQARAVATWDTSQALRTVAESSGPGDAAIAAPEGAAAFGLTMLRRGIGNQDDIQSRFVALAREALPIDPRVPSKTSLILSTQHQHGALLKCLQTLSDHGVSLTKLESRPRRNRPWEYMFFIDFEGHVAAPNVAAALAELRAQALFLKVLGCYPAKATPADPQPSRVRPRTGAGKRPAPRAGTSIRVGDLLIGGTGFTVIAGPTAVTSRSQIDKIARFLREQGAHLLSAGVFAPPTATGPRARENRGLELLALAGKAHGIATITEVMLPDQVKTAAGAIDVLRIGASNMQNLALLREVGKIDRPVLLERGLSSTIDEWLEAAEFIVSQGNGQVMLCERGIRTFGDATSTTLDLASVVMLRKRSRLPVLVDPSRGTGHRQFVEPMALAARASGAHGVAIEVDVAPSPTGLDFAAFGRLMDGLAAVRAAP